MICYTNVSRAVGERFTGGSEFEGPQYPNQPFVVVRVASREEWIAYARSLNCSWPYILEALAMPDADFFYEVATD